MQIMDWFFHIGLFVASCVMLYISGEMVVRNLMKLSRFLGLTEFVVAFFVMAVATSIPNIFVGITSALQGVPELSLGDVFGNNITALTLAVAAAVLFSPQKEISIESRTVQTTSTFTIIAAILPLILLLDHTLSRIDGIILIAFFFFYTAWLFSRRDNFSKIYEKKEAEQTMQKTTITDIAKNAFKNVLIALVGIFLMFLAAQGVVFSSSFFALYLGIPIAMVGLIIVGFGNALPEVYFSIASARRGETFMILGNLLGSVIFPATLVLGVVSLVHPIFISEASPLAASRAFVAIAAVLFLVFARTRNIISRNEGILLFVLYAGFIATLALTI